MKRLLAVWAAAALLAVISTYATAGEPEVQSNEPPVAMVTENFVRGSVPMNVCFDASKSHDPEGKPLEYEWDFGDGSRTAATAETCHEYVQPGLYAATVTVTDDQGLQGRETVVVHAREKEAARATPGT